MYGWLTAFESSTSHDVFNRIITSKMNHRNNYRVPSTICLCSGRDYYDCRICHLGPIYIGQTLKLNLIILTDLVLNPDSSIILQVLSSPLLFNGCKIKYLHELIQTHPHHGCNEYNYTIWANDSTHTCELYLKYAQTIIETFYISILPCPIGFSFIKHERACHCDPVLQNDLIFVKSCNIDDATIQCPANSWIAISDINSYYVSLNCPFDYCLPESSYINLPNPDTQCQYDRTGLLCAQCPLNLSLVLGSSQCKQCSNIHLLIILPLAASGIILVIILFIFNLTVTSSYISTIIFYANIININSPVLFPKHHSLVYVLISLLNINLGIEACFYKGMDGYDKSWLQLVFPMYLFVLVIVIVIASRYSTRIQRLTACRVLPVLATLLILCYTNILQAVSMALFFYSRVTYLPSMEHRMVWSVATDVELFAFKFFILFAICLIVFLLFLLPFNMVLLFSKKLAYFKVVNYFKPLIDAYHGPYKDNFYYWTGVQLLIRKVAFGLSVLDNKISFLSISVLLAVFFSIHSMVKPFKKDWLSLTCYQFM